MNSEHKKSEVRERILKTASRLFFRYGCHATGINRIIAESGVAKATFYAHFPSKDQLTLEWLDERESEWVKELLSRVRAARSLEGRIKALFSIWRTQIASEGYRGCSFVNVAGEFPDESSPVRLRVRKHKEYVRSLIDKEIFEGYCVHLSPDTHNNLVSGIYCLFDSAIVETQNVMDDWPIQVAESTVLFLVNQCILEVGNA